MKSSTYKSLAAGLRYNFLIAESACKTNNDTGSSVGYPALMLVKYLNLSLTYEAKAIREDALDPTAKAPGLKWVSFIAHLFK